MARIKVAACDGEAVYHAMTRVVNGERLIDSSGREVLRKQLWQVAAYCGVELLTYAILSNHFHVLVRVPRFTSVSDDELLRRYRILYPRPTRYQQARIEAVARQLKTNGPEAMAWRRRQLALMHDISSYMKLVKQRYSIWHNKAYQRFGTLWAERFKSVLVEPEGRVPQAVAAYIDLNPVRAGLATDPKDYRFCGYAEAVAGSERAQAGLGAVFGGNSWSHTQARYRQILFGKGCIAREGRAVLTAENFADVIAEEGKLPLADVLRCRIRYFADGAVLGSCAFVVSHLARYRANSGLRRKCGIHHVPAITDWGEMATLRGLRREPFG